MIDVYYESPTKENDHLWVWGLGYCPITMDKDLVSFYLDRLDNEWISNRILSAKIGN